MNLPKISVIVAVYNVEQYLNRCINSILCQTYQNIELILVVDGATDNSLKICSDFARRDNRIKVICKENGGQSTARNAGLEIAGGDYIGFVDGDDWIEPEMYHLLASVISNDDADIVQCGWYIADNIGNKRNKNPLQFREILSSDEALDALIAPSDKHLNTSVCCKLFRRDIATKCRFLPVRAYEDDDYIFHAVSIANTIVCIDTPLYNYFNRPNSTMTASFNMNKLALVTVQRNICGLIQLRYPCRFNEIQKILCSKQFYILSCLNSHPELSGAEQAAANLKSDILCSYSDYMRNPLMGKNKLMLWLLKYTPRFIWVSVLKSKVRII